MLNQPINEILEYDSADNNYDIGCYEYRELMLNIDDIDFGEVSYGLLSEAVLVTITNISEEDILITSIEASDHFLIKKDMGDNYKHLINQIDLPANSDVTFWVACRPLYHGLVDGEISIYSDAIPSIEVITVSASVNLINVPKLFNNFPNPFNPETTIKFSIPQESKVKLIVYNLKGQKVKSLVDATCEIGINTAIWDGTNNFGNKVGTGVYFYKLDVDGKTIKTKKMLLLK